MLQLKKAVLLLLVCYCANSLALMTTVRIYSREWNMPPSNTTFLKQGTLFQTGTNTYPLAECEITDSKTERVCNITLVAEGLKENTCNGIKIFADEGTTLFYDGYFQIIPFTRDHVAVSWYEEPEYPRHLHKVEYVWKMTLLNLNTCSSQQLSFIVDKVEHGFIPSVVYYDNQVDFIVHSKKTCGLKKRCKISFDLDGLPIGEIEPYHPHFAQYASAVSEQDPSKGFFVHPHNLKSLAVILVDTRGHGKHLSPVPLELEATEENRLFSFSNANELYSICRMHKDVNPTFIDCAQYDGEGYATVKGSIKLERDADWMAVRSLARGVILIATSGADESQPKNFRVYKIDANETEVKYLDLEGPDFKCKDKENGLDARIVESVRKEICFDFTCQDGTHKIKYLSRCESSMPF